MSQNFADPKNFRFIGEKICCRIRFCGRVTAVSKLIEAPVNWTHQPEASYGSTIRTSLGQRYSTSSQFSTVVGVYSELHTFHNLHIKTKTKLHGLSPRANYTDRVTAACRRSDCQLLRIEGCHVVSVTDPYGRILGFIDKSRYFSIK
jgi:hypothetical protein